MSWDGDGRAGEENSTLLEAFEGDDGRNEGGFLSFGKAALYEVKHIEIGEVQHIEHG